MKNTFEDGLREGAALFDELASRIANPQPQNIETVKQSFLQAYAEDGEEGVELAIKAYHEGLAASIAQGGDMLRKRAQDLSTSKTLPR